MHLLNLPNPLKKAGAANAPNALKFVRPML
jgi:hypothetical protein